MFDKEFKTAIHNLSDLEKDKLILRLLRKDLRKFLPTYLW